MSRVCSKGRVGLPRREGRMGKTSDEGWIKRALETALLCRKSKLVGAAVRLPGD